MYISDGNEKKRETKQTDKQIEQAEDDDAYRPMHTTRDSKSGSVVLVRHGAASDLLFDLDISDARSDGTTGFSFVRMSDELVALHYELWHSRQVQTIMLSVARLSWDLDSGERARVSDVTHLSQMSREDGCLCSDLGYAIWKEILASKEAKPKSGKGKARASTPRLAGGGKPAAKPKAKAKKGKSKGGPRAPDSQTLGLDDERVAEGGDGAGDADFDLQATLDGIMTELGFVDDDDGDDGVGDQYSALHAHHRYRGLGT